MNCSEMKVADTTDLVMGVIHPFQVTAHARRALAFRYGRAVHDDCLEAAFLGREKRHLDRAGVFSLQMDDGLKVSAVIDQMRILTFLPRKQKQASWQQAELFHCIDAALTASPLLFTLDEIVNWGRNSDHDAHGDNLRALRKEISSRMQITHCETEQLREDLARAQRELDNQERKCARLTRALIGLQSYLCEEPERVGYFSSNRLGSMSEQWMLEKWNSYDRHKSYGLLRGVTTNTSSQ